MRGNRWGVVALVGALVSAAPLSAQTQTITLEEAVSMALRAHPTVVRARGQVTTAAWGKREAIGSWLPSISSSSSYSTRPGQEILDPQTGQIFTPTTSSYSAGLSASLQLFSGFRRFAESKAAGADMRSAEASLVSQEFSVILQTKQTFFNAVAANELVRVAERSIQRAEEQLRISKDKLAAGSAIRSDTLRGRVELGNARLLLLNAETQRATAEANLARLIGVDGPIRPAADSMMFAPAQLDTAALRLDAVSMSPGVIQADAAADAAAASVSVARAGYFPSISASYSRSWSGQALSELDPSWSARLSMNLPIFNGFTREGGVTRASVSRDAAYAEAEDVRRQINAELTQYLASLAAAEQSIDIAQASLAAAEEELRVQQERYRLGMATIIELLASQISLEQSEVDIVQTRLDYFVAKAQIESLVGREL